MNVSPKGQSGSHVERILDSLSALLLHLPAQSLEMNSEQASHASFPFSAALLIKAFFIYLYNPYI